MDVFEALLALLIGATVLSSVARRLSIPYPTLLALGGALLALLPGSPRLDLPPELILALFVAPVLLDAAFDASFRDLRANWAPVLSLVLVAVAVTTVAVAVVARWFFPDMPWAAAIALGALVAPPDAVAALAVLKQVNPPHRIRMVLEGESLLNDASALLIYRLAIGAAAAGSFSPIEALPTFAIVVLGSVAAGWLASLVSGPVLARVHDAPSSVILQFVGTFAVWLLAERLGLSGVVTIVVYGLALGRRTVNPMPARLRVPSFAIWETVTMVLNVLAFTLIGLQLRPILEASSGGERTQWLVASAGILGTVIIVRIGWVMTHHVLAHLLNGQGEPRPAVRHSLVIGWSGMRGIVTLAAAMALPAGFPYRDFIQLAAFMVVLGTLVVQGITLGPLMALLRLPRDTLLEQELAQARKAVLTAAMGQVETLDTPAARRLRLEYAEAMGRVRAGADPRDRTDNALRRRAVAAAREAIQGLRHTGVIGDEAYRKVEEELDWLDLSARPAGTPDQG